MIICSVPLQYSKYLIEFVPQIVLTYASNQAKVCYREGNRPQCPPREDFEFRNMPPAGQSSMLGDLVEPTVMDDLRQNEYVMEFSGGRYQDQILQFKNDIYKKILTIMPIFCKQGDVMNQRTAEIIAQQVNLINLRTSILLICPGFHEGRDGYKINTGRKHHSHLLVWTSVE